MKYLIWAVVVYFAWRWYLASKQKSAEQDAGDPSAAGASPASSAAAAAAAVTDDGAAEKMIACAHCRIHLPLSEALTGADHRYYCSEEHRALHVAS